MSASTTTFSWDKTTWAPLTEMADGFDEYRPAPVGVRRVPLLLGVLEGVAR